MQAVVNSQVLEIGDMNKRLADFRAATIGEIMDQKTKDAVWGAKVEAAYILMDEIKLRKAAVAVLEKFAFYDSWMDRYADNEMSSGYRLVTFGDLREAQRLIKEAASRSLFQCAGRRQALPEPGECDWPVCGCDPHAEKVIEALQDAGLLVPGKRIEAGGPPPIKASDGFGTRMSDECKSDLDLIDRYSSRLGPDSTS